jgi:uncharacterized membrane protein YGL010W
MLSRISFVSLYCSYHRPAKSLALHVVAVYTCTIKVSVMLLGFRKWTTSSVMFLLLRTLLNISSVFSVLFSISLFNIC